MKAIQKTYGGEFRHAIYLSDAGAEEHQGADDVLKQRIVNVFARHNSSGPQLLQNLLHPDHPLQKGLVRTPSLLLLQALLT